MFETFAAEKIQISAQDCIATRELQALRGKAELRSRMDYMQRHLVLTLESYVHAIPKERVVVHRKFPKNWWEAFKERWFPRWALSRFPVQYEHIDVDQTIYGAVCPHLMHDPQRKHLEWMAYGNEAQRGCRPQG